MPARAVATVVVLGATVVEEVVVLGASVVEVVRVLADVDIALPDEVVRGGVDTLGFLVDQVGLEKHHGAAEALVADGDDLSIRQLIVHLELEGLGSLGRFCKHQKEEQYGESPST